jgi:hypothetical protein
VALALATFGCAQEREPVSRIQPNALKKSFFVGENLQDTKDDPEFWYRGTVVDTGYGAQQDGLFTSTYAMPVSRIKWEVAETMLVARLAYERIADTDGKAGTEKGKEGQVVAAFPILSHFDIRRSYNPVTGEEQNIVEENAIDRPWYEREHFRVDWSRNMVTNAYDFDTLSMIGVYGGVNYEPMQYYVTDPTSPDAPVFDEGYFDVTQKVYATPQMVHFSPDMAALFGIASFPACMLDADFGGGSGPTGNCNPHELKLRLSFRKVVDTDYEAQDWDGVRFQAFGAFTVNFSGRLGYTRPYGIVDDKTHRFIERYNIWKKSHYYDTAGNAVVCGTPETEAASKVDGDGNGTIDACEAVAAATGLSGSRCDVYAKKCTLPFRAREDKPIVWYHLDGTVDPFQKTAGDSRYFDSTGGELDAQGNPIGLFNATNWATVEWDVAMRSARTAARLTECKKTGDAAACEAQFPVWHGQMDDQEDAIRLTREVELCRRANKAWNTTACDFVVDQKAAAWGITDPGVIAIAKQKEAVIMCHNPVVDNDHPDCHTPFQNGQEKKVRLGDLRYNVVNIINTPQTPSAWGIMVDAKDPLTGENIAASINIWNHVTDMASQGAIDIVRYINGELSTADITDGTFIKDWVLANEGIAGGSRTAPPMNKDEVVKRLSATLDAKDPKGIEKLQAAFENYLQGKPAEGAVAKEVQSLKKLNKDLRASGSLKDSVRAPLLQQRMERARGTELEAALINKPALEAAGIDPSQASQLGGSTIDMVSPFRMGNSMVASRIKRARQNALAERGACLIEASPEFSSVVGFARIMNEKFPLQEGESKDARAERMRKYFARRMHYGVIIHEMGHSFGERHNFVSSFDAVSFRPQYWQLRTRNGQVNQACADAFERDASGNVVKDASGNPIPHNGENCVGPRYFDPMTKQEEDGLLWMWQQSSVMDYPGDVTVDTLGLGAYDFAATRMFYGESTSVFSNDGTRGNNVNIRWSTDTDNDGYPDAFETALGSDPNNAASVPNRFGNPDTNGNKIPDAVEALLAGDPRVANPTDSDEDGVSDAYERLLGTNPNNKSDADANAAGDIMRYRTLGSDSQMTRDFLDRMDQFGGILGLRTGDSHYSLHQAKYNLLRTDQCVDVDPQAYRPSDWNEAVDGAYHNTLDARVVAVDGAFKRCRQQSVDYVDWSQLQTATSQTDEQTVTGDNPPAIDPQGRIRVPYPFASDNWADLGNVSVYRHDQGADVYEQFMFLMGSQENRHIFDNYRRNRTTFAIRPAIGRSFGRYTEKIMHAVKGLGLYRNLYTTDYVGGIWPFAAGGFLADNVLAASLAMDHFSRQLTRPQSGEHYLFGDLIDSSIKPIMRSAEDTFIVGPQIAQDDDTAAFTQLEFATNEAEKQAALEALKNARGDNPARIVIPNGSSGYQANGFTSVGFGGRPINNDLDRSKGDYSSSYQLTVGSYYDKVNAILAFTESQDNFISSSRTDFVDARYRATSVADVFPEGFRRLIGAALTDDAEVLGPRVAGRANTLPVTNFLTDKQIARFPELASLAGKNDRCADSNSDCVLGEDGNPYPKQPMAWTSWWPADGPRNCWNTNGTQICARLTTPDDGAPAVVSEPFEQLAPKFSIPVDPQVGWEVQKHIIAWIYAYLPENNRLDWFDMMRIFRSYDMPEIKGAVVRWRDPNTGTLYAARSYGKEVINGKEVEIGIAARVLARCNELTLKAYQADDIDPLTGEITLRLDDNGQPITNKVNLGSGVVSDLPVVDVLKRYKSVPELMWQAGMAYGIYPGGLKGIYLALPPARGCVREATPPVPGGFLLFGLRTRGPGQGAARPPPPGARRPRPPHPPRSARRGAAPAAPPGRSSASDRPGGPRAPALPPGPGKGAWRRGPARSPDLRPASGPGPGHRRCSAPRRLAPGGASSPRRGRARATGSPAPRQRNAPAGGTRRTGPPRSPGGAGSRGGARARGSLRGDPAADRGPPLRAGRAASSPAAARAWPPRGEGEAPVAPRRAGEAEAPGPLRRAAAPG